MDYYAHGKLLLTGEYLILKGVKSLTVPTTRGQRLQTKKIDSNHLEWISYDLNNQIWFSGIFTSKGECLESTDSKIAEGIRSILRASMALGGNSWVGQKAIFYLEFEREWGLGSSSTMTSLVGQWLGVDPMKLHFKTSRGSGYDVAIAQTKSAGIYQLTQKGHSLKPLVYDPPFADDLFFVHLNQKQDSAQDVKSFLQNSSIEKHLLDSINQSTQNWLSATSIQELERVIVKHEEVLSQCLGKTTIKNSLFADYTGCVKSLGAWGGDFVLVTRKEALTYFPSKGYPTVLTWDQMVLG